MSLVHETFSEALQWHAARLCSTAVHELMIGHMRQLSAGVTPWRRPADAGRVIAVSTCTTCARATQPRRHASLSSLHADRLRQRTHAGQLVSCVSQVATRFQPGLAPVFFRARVQR